MASVILTGADGVDYLVAAVGTDLGPAVRAQTGGGGGGVANPGDRQVFASGLASPKATVGGWSLLQNGVSYFSGYRTNNGTAALNDSITTYEVWLDAGTWQCDILGQSGTNGGILTGALVGATTLTFPTTADQYNTSNAGFGANLGSVTVTTGGLFSFRLTLTSKNASSSAYRMFFSGAFLTRTA